MDKIPPGIRQDQLAALAGLTVKGIQALLKSGDPPPRSTDGYPCKDAGEWLKRRHLRGLGVDQDGKRYDFDSERARLTHHQANKTALEEQVLRGTLIPCDRVQQVWSEMASNFRARMLSIPAKAAPTLLACADLQQAEDLLAGLIADALSELANNDPEQYRIKPDQDHPSGAKAPAKAHRKPVGRSRKTPSERGKRRAGPVEH